MESEDTVRRSGRLSQREAAAAESMPAPAGKPCGRSGKKGGESRGRSVAPWSEKVPGETLETFTARVTSMVKSHTKGKAALSKLQGELQQAEALYSSTSEKKRTGIAEHIQKLRGRIAEVEECQAIIERNAGPFREKFLNDRRFLDMKRRGEKEEACVGGPAGAVDMPSDSCASRADALPSAAASAGEAPPTAETPPSGPACVPPPSQPSVQPGVRAQPTAPPTTETPPSGPTCVPAPSQPSVQSGVRAPPATPPIAPPTAVSGTSRTGSLDGGEERSGRGLAGGGQEALPAMEDVVDETQGSQPVMASQDNIYSGLRPDQVALPSSGSSAEEEDMEGSQGLMTAIRLQESPVSLQHFQFGDEDPGPGKAKRRQRKKAQETVAMCYVFNDADAAVSCVTPAGHGCPEHEVGPRRRSGGEKDSNVSGMATPTEDSRGGRQAVAPDICSVAEFPSLPPAAPGSQAGGGSGSGGAVGEKQTGGHTSKKSVEPGTQNPGPSDTQAQKAKRSKSVGGKGSKRDNTVVPVARALKPAPGDAGTVIVSGTPPASNDVDVVHAEGMEGVHDGGEDVGMEVVSGVADGSGGAREAGRQRKNEGPSVRPKNPGAVAPMAEGGTRARSFAEVAAAGGGESLSGGSGQGDLQRRLLDALKRGEESITVGDREVDLSFWIDRHGLSAFRESGAENIRWSLPTTGQGGGRRNVVRLRWEGNEACPSRDKVVELFLGMGFRANDIYALIHPYGATFFDVSFVRLEGLELFWSQYELARICPEWRGFIVQAISRQNSVKKVTVLTSNESLSEFDILTWLGRFGEVVQVPKKNLDKHGIWSGAWTFMMKLKVSGYSVTHIPTSTFLGRDRILIFYQGQPKLCHRCGSPSHFSAGCKVEKCAMCGGVGHLAASCRDIRCNLCGVLGHPFSRCPRSYANGGPNPGGAGQEEVRTRPAGEGTSSGSGGKGPVRNGPPPEARGKEKRSGRVVEKDRGVMSLPSVPSSGEHAAEVPDSDLDEEIRRMVREDGATAPMSSSSEGVDEEGNKGWQKQRKRENRKTRRKGNSREKTNQGQMPKEGSFSLPPVELSNQYRALSESSLSPDGGEEGGLVLGVADKDVGAKGDAGPSSSGAGETGPPVGGVDPGPPDKGKSVHGKCKNEAVPRKGIKITGMDVSVCLKRTISSSEEECIGAHARGKGGGKKVAVQLDHP